jgi:hypothetical protein
MSSHPSGMAAQKRSLKNSGDCGAPFCRGFICRRWSCGVDPSIIERHNKIRIFNSNFPKPVVDPKTGEVRSRGKCMPKKQIPQREYSEEPKIKKKPRTRTFYGWV